MRPLEKTNGERASPLPQTVDFRLLNSASGPWAEFPGLVLGRLRPEGKCKRTQ